MKQQIALTLNGDKWEVEVEPNDTLLEVLRGKLGIKSPKVACDRGDCGACTVLLNGKTVRSCLVLAIEIDGQEIVTLEGLAGFQGMAQNRPEKFDFMRGAPAASEQSILDIYEHREQGRNKAENQISTGLSPLQEAFAKSNAFQCGFCAPGVILSATELLQKNPHPTKEMVQEAISGNLCRCTGYSAIIDTVLEFSKQEKGHEE